MIRLGLWVWERQRAILITSYHANNMVTCYQHDLSLLMLTGHGTSVRFNTGKGVRQGCTLSPAYLTSMQGTSCKTPGWMKHKLESVLPEKSHNLRLADLATLKAESKEEPDSVRKESACNAEGPGLIPGVGRSPGGGNGSPLQYSCLRISHGQRSLAGNSPCGPKESDTAELLLMQVKRRVWKMAQSSALRGLAWRSSG